MAMKNFSSLIPRVAPFLVGCPNDLIQFELSNAARIFAADTGSYRIRYNGTCSTQIKPEIPDNTTILNIVSCSGGIVAILDDNQPGIITATGFDANNPPQVTIEISLIPANGCTELEEWFFNLYSEAFVELALYRLMLMLDRPWANPQVAALHYQAYEGLRNNTITRLTSKSTDTNTGSQLDDLTTELTEILPQCPEYLIRKAILNAINIFTRETASLNTEETFTEKDFQAKPVGFVELTPTAGMTVFSVLKCIVNNCQLKAHEFKFDALTDKKLFFIPPINYNQLKIHVVYAMVPKDNAPLPTDYFLRYQRAFKAYAIYKLTSMVQRPWSNANYGQTELQEFLMLKQEAIANMQGEGDSFPHFMHINPLW